MKNLIFFLLIACFLSLDAFPQWTWRNPLPQGHDLESSWFFSPDTGFFCGSGGTVMKTTNGGSSWSTRQISSTYGESSYLYDLSFTDQNHGYLLETWTNVYKSSDGGENWTRIYHEEIGEDITGVAFRDTLNGFIVGSGGLLLITANGGTTWNRIILDQDEYFTEIYFTTPDSGFILSAYGSIMNTSDGGESWNLLVSGVSAGLRGIHFANSQQGYVYGDYGVLLKTMDGGASWNLCPTPDSLSIYSLSSIGFDTIIMIGEVDYGWYSESRFLRSADGGFNWSDITYDTEYQRLLTVACLQDGTCYTAGSSGLMIKSKDSGETWSYLSSLITPNIISDFDFPTADVGYASMYNYEVVHDITVLKTIDGGDTWFPLDTIFEDEIFYTVDFSSEDFGFIGGNNIYRTTDGGNTWSRRYSSTWDKMILSIDFPFPTSGIAVGQGGLILHSSNLGFTWDPIESGTQDDLHSVCMPDNDTGYIAGGSTFMKTVDGGYSWDALPVPFIGFWGMCFLDAKTGYVTCSDGVIKTTDGGLTWLNAGPPYIEDPIRYVSFFDADTGYIGGGTYVMIMNSVLLKTTDGGISWKEENIPVGSPIVSIYVTSTNKVYASAGYIYFLGKSSDMTTGITDLFPELNNGFVKCYPNPFHSSTTITYQIENKSQVQLVIKDISGKVVRELFDGEQYEGIHEIIFDGVALHSGIYFYCLKINIDTYTGKILLTR